MPAPSRLSRRRAVAACGAVAAALVFHLASAPAPPRRDFGPGDEARERLPADGARRVDPTQASAIQATVQETRDLPLRYVRRVDGASPGHRHFEPSIAARSGSGADDDVLDVLWMEASPAGTTMPTHLAWASSGNGGNTWISEPLNPPDGASGAQFDAMSAVDPTSGRMILGGMSRDFSVGAIDTLWLASRDSGAAQPSGGRLLLREEGVDKGALATGPSPLGGQALYLAYAVGPDGYLQRSRDGGATFEPRRPLPTGIGYLPRVARNGTLTISYAIRKLSGITAAFVRSDDGLQSLSAPVTIGPFAATDAAIEDATPGSFRVAFFVMHAVDPVSGRIYAVYNDVTGRVQNEADLDIVMQYSDDGGATWSKRRIVNSHPDGRPAAQFLPWIECDSRGGVHLAYFDNRRNAVANASPHALVDVYYARSTDRGATWQEQRLTDVPLDSADTLWNPTGNPVQFVGDYLGLAVSDRAAYVAYPGSDGNHGMGMFVARIDLDDTRLLRCGRPTIPRITPPGCAAATGPSP